MNLSAVIGKRCNGKDVRCDDLRFLTTESAEAFQARSREFLTCEKLVDFRRNSHLVNDCRAWFAHASCWEPQVRDQAVRTLVLHGRATYEAQFAIGPPINLETGLPAGKYTETYDKWAASHGKPVLSEEEAAQVERMAMSVRAHAHATALLDNGVACGVVRTEHNGLPCQARIDWLNPERGIVAFKLCERLIRFTSTFDDCSYANEAVFWQSLVACATGLTLPVHVIAGEEREPFRCGVWQMGEKLLTNARKQNDEPISLMRTQSRDGQWPTGYEDVRVLDVT